jgi:hypothetical protein
MANPAVAALPPAPGDPAVDSIFDSIVNSETGQIAHDPMEYLPEVDKRPSWQRPELYTGIAELLLTDQQVAILTAPVTDAEIEIKPDSFGAVYLCHASYRKRLNAAFQPGGWAQRQISEWQYDDDKKMLTAEFALYARGSNGKVCYVSKAIGGQKYWGGKGKSDMTYDDAAQGAESNALTRNCKQLGIALEMWEKRTANEYRNRLGVCVFVESNDGRSVAWRRYDEPRLKGEAGIHPQSPNQDKYQPPQAKRPAASAPAQATAPQQPAAQPSARQSAPAPANGTPEWGKNGIISEAQARRLYAMTRQYNVSEEAVGTYLKTRFKYTSSKQIEKKHYNTICKWVEGGGD